MEVTQRLNALIDGMAKPSRLLAGHLPLSRLTHPKDVGIDMDGMENTIGLPGVASPRYGDPVVVADQWSGSKIGLCSNVAASC